MYKLKMLSKYRFTIAFVISIVSNLCFSCLGYTAGSGRYLFDKVEFGFCKNSNTILDQELRTLQEIQRFQKGPEGWKNFRILEWNGVEITGAASPRESDLSYIYSNYQSAFILDKNSPILKDQGNHSLQVTYTEIMDYQPPSFDQIKLLLKVVHEAKKKKQKVLIHCDFGGGRTGTMLAFLLLYQDVMNLDKAKLDDIRFLNLPKVPLSFDPGNKYLSNNLKAHRFVASVIEKLRNKDREQIGLVVSVENKPQVEALEMFFRMMVLSHRSQIGLMTDEQIENIVTQDISPETETAVFVSVDQMISGVREGFNIP